MVTQVIPDVLIAINERQSVRDDVEPPVFVVDAQVGLRGDLVELAVREGPAAPLLLVARVDDAREQRGALLGRVDVGALLRAAGVEVRALRRVGDTRPCRRVLRPEAVFAVVVAAGAQRQHHPLDIVGVAAEADPGRAARVVGEGVVDLRDAFGHVVDGRDVAAEVEEVARAVARVPVELLPGVGRVEARVADGVRDGGGEVAVVRQCLQPEQRLELPDRCGVALRDQAVEVVDDPVEPGHAVLWRVLLDRVVPSRIADGGGDGGARGDAAIQDVAVLFDGECGLCPCQASAVQDPGRPRCCQVTIDTGELDVLGEKGIVCKRLRGRQVCQIVGGRAVVRVALAVISILQDNTKAIGRFHENLDNARPQVGKPTWPACFPANVQENRSACIEYA